MDTTESTRRKLVPEINAVRGERQLLEDEHGQVWDTAELQKDFSVESFLAPYVMVREKATGRTGSMTFQHRPRYYFGFRAD